MTQMKVFRRAGEEGHGEHSLIATGRSVLEDDVCEVSIQMRMPSILRDCSQEP